MNLFKATVLNLGTALFPSQSNQKGSYIGISSLKFSNTKSSANHSYCHCNSNLKFSYFRHSHQITQVNLIQDVLQPVSYLSNHQILQAFICFCFSIVEIFKNLSNSLIATFSSIVLQGVTCWFFTKKFQLLAKVL